MDAAPRTTPIRLEPTVGSSRVAVVGLGANLGRPEVEFLRALAALQSVARLCSVSSLYRSAPIGPPQPDFLNAAVLLEETPPLERLLLDLKRLEQEAGRVRGQHWGPRVLDLDILWAGNRQASSSSLIVPHAQLVRRAFALAPLLELVPDAHDPKIGTPYAPILRTLETQSCRRVAGQNWWREIDLSSTPE